MARPLKKSCVGFYLDRNDLQKLWKLSEAHGFDNSKTMRAILNEAYDRHQNERSSDDATL
jgi:Zn-finger nucleic acid-binding protein